MRELTFFPLLERYPMTSPYGPRIDPITGAAGDMHGGVDYGAPFGTPVIAPFDGIVTTGWESGAGNWSWVDDGPYRFKSFHHAEAVVYSGWVPAGAVIAYIDSTGSSTGSHAHLELWDHGTRIDPTGFFERAPLRDEDWFDMANEDDLRRIVREELDASEQEMRSWTFGTLDQFFKRFCPLNAVWTDGANRYEVSLDGGRRVRRLLDENEEDQLYVARALNNGWVMDVSVDPTYLHSLPLVGATGGDPD